MGALSLISDVALAIHIISIIGLMVLLLMQVNKSPRRIHPGTWHSALTALAMGLLMVGIRTPLHNDDPAKWPELDNTIIGIKFSILIVILVLIHRNYKKPQVRNSIWAALIGLTTANILLALFG
ncbi:MAG TPA: hypothetical protein VMW30_09420 [Candidatus Paceibacterota bacterium]|nr:hypothetical protein [Candidatus Paceibacterota bacterium]